MIEHPRDYAKILFTSKDVDPSELLETSTVFALCSPDHIFDHPVTEPVFIPVLVQSELDIWLLRLSLS